MIEREEMPYRDSTIAIIVDKDHNFLIANKLSYRDNEWNFPGGGVDEGETALQAVLRELNEELGSNDFQVLGQSQITNTYDFPDEVLETNFQKRGIWQRGQRITQFVVLFTGDKKQLIVGDGMRKLAWVTRADLPQRLIFPGQWQNISQVLLEFKL